MASGLSRKLRKTLNGKRANRTMPGRLLSIVLVAACFVVSSCAKRPLAPAGQALGTPLFAWVFMSGDLDNPDREFVCLSTPVSECVVPASSPENRVFSDLFFYYHGAGGETKYTGSIQIGF